MPLYFKNTTSKMRHTRRKKAAKSNPAQLLGTRLIEQGEIPTTNHDLPQEK